MVKSGPSGKLHKIVASNAPKKNKGNKDIIHRYVPIDKRQPGESTNGQGNPDATI